MPMGCGQLTNSIMEFDFFFALQNVMDHSEWLASPASFKQAKYCTHESIVKPESPLHERIHCQRLVVEPDQELAIARSCLVMSKLFLRCFGVLGVIIKSEALSRESRRSF